MKAAVIRKYGKPEVFQIEEMPEPAPKSNQVKVKIIASSVNPVDWKVRSGALAVLTGWKFPRILGGDFAGTVVECGSEVNDIKIGDEVFGLSNAMSIGRAYAEYITCDANKLAIKPGKLSFLESGSIPLAGSTAYQALHNMGKIKPGMRVLITGATGGVGHFAVQIAKAENCHVTGVCHSRNAELAKQIGCDEVLTYDTTNVTKSKNRYDIIFDAAAKYGYLSCRSMLTSKGTFVSTLPMPFLMMMHGFSYIFPWKKGRFVGVMSNRKDLDQLARLGNEGKLHPFIENTFPLEKIAEAHALSETEKVRGKIAIRISHEI
jgi:NADPH:quinone reductase-like Zn-dependent oxidoreductase